MSFHDDRSHRPLDALREWQQALPRQRALVIEGFDGAHGVRLQERRAGVWFYADYGSADTAAIALTGFVRWRHSDPPVARRGRPQPLRRK